MMLHPSQDNFTPEDCEFLRHLAYRKLCASQYRAAYLLYAVMARVEPYHCDYFLGQIYCLLHENNPEYYDHVAQLIDHCQTLELTDEGRQILNICTMRLRHNHNKFQNKPPITPPINSPIN